MKDGGTGAKSRKYEPKNLCKNDTVFSLVLIDFPGSFNRRRVDVGSVALRSSRPSVQKMSLRHGIHFV
jgi:hypothetical protein